MMTKLCEKYDNEAIMCITKTRNKGEVGRLRSVRSSIKIEGYILDKVA